MEIRSLGQKPRLPSLPLSNPDRNMQESIDRRQTFQGIKGAWFWGADFLSFYHFTLNMMAASTPTRLTLNWVNSWRWLGWRPICSNGPDARITKSARIEGCSSSWDPRREYSQLIKILFSFLKFKFQARYLLVLFGASLANQIWIRNVKSINV